MVLLLFPPCVFKLLREEEEKQKRERERKKKKKGKRRKGEKKMGKFSRRKIKVNFWSWSKNYFCKKINMLNYNLKNYFCTEDSVKYN
jgi:hypothetical protein